MADKNAQRQCDCRHVVVKAKETSRERPHPWILLKFTVALTLAIIGYTSYVYIARLCIPMILRQSGALGGREIGIVFLTVYSILLIMLMWTYSKIVFTSPGIAADHVPRSDRPVFPVQRYPDPTELPQTEMSSVPPTAQVLDTSTTEPPKEAEDPGKKSRRTKSVSNASVLKKPQPAHIKYPSQASQSPGDTRPQPGVMQSSTDARQVAAPLVVKPPTPVMIPTKAERSAIVQQPGMPVDFYRNSRRPQLTPVLLPQYRYCYQEQIVKPFRTHHCRACGKCILKYDHHCPWVGQCVGARNQKFFINFLEWTPLFCLWVFASTLALTVKASKNPDTNLDPQVIVTIVLGGVFGLFTATMLANQVRLALLNRTTLEAMQASHMKESDLDKLNRLHRWYDVSGKRRTTQQWDEEWGHRDTEGNLWWMGSFRANWEDVMGSNRLWWILPIGRSPNDGLTYERNARFHETGVARPRKEWPPELR